GSGPQGRRARRQARPASGVGGRPRQTTEGEERMSDLNNLTANVRVTNPTARRIVGRVFGWAAVALLAAGIVDQAVPAIDIAVYLGTASTIVLGLFGLWQLIVTDANVPREQVVGVPMTRAQYRLYRQALADDVDGAS